MAEPMRFLISLSDRQIRIEIMLVLALGLPLAVIAFRARSARLLDAERRTRAGVEAASRELRILQAALDHVDYGVLLLDENLRARFINQASRQLWNMPEALANNRPAFIDLMRHACNSGAFALPASERGAYVKRASTSCAPATRRRLTCSSPTAASCASSARRCPRAAGS